MRSINDQMTGQAFGESGTAMYAEWYGTHDETKPTKGVATGSKFTEVDTGDVYRFDEISGTWYKQNAD